MYSELSRRMEFDHVIRVHADGSITDAEGVWAPELFDDELPSDSQWTLMDGFSGQFRYAGPMMHASEYIGGGMERHILANPGLYVALVNTPADDSEPTEWAVAYILDAQS